MPFGCLLVAFWNPFGNLLVAFWVAFESLGDIFGRLCINFSRFGDVCWVVGVWGVSGKFFKHFPEQLKDVLSGPLLIQVYRLPWYPFSVIRS